MFHYGESCFRDQVSVSELKFFKAHYDMKKLNATIILYYTYFQWQQSHQSHSVLCPLLCPAESLDVKEMPFLSIYQNRV